MEQVPLRYLPKRLTKKDTRRQLKNLRKSRRLYKRGVFFERPKVRSFKSKPSKHLRLAEKMYGVDSVLPNKDLSNATKCSVESLQKIVKKGEGAYYSSGSRPNQTARSWGIARLASSITGGKASAVDFSILERGCNHRTSKAYRLAKRSLKKHGYGRSSTKHINTKIVDNNK